MDNLGIGIISVLGSLGLVFFTAYMKEKGKNQGLKEDNKKLEDDKQKIIAKYQIEMEEIKKQHTLEIEKKKFQYQDKRTQFSKFFILLDEFNGKCNVKMMEEFQPIVNELYDSFKVDDEVIHREAYVKYTKKIVKLFFELNADHQKILTETNSIRLISSSKIDIHLNSLQLILKLATDKSLEMFQLMGTQDFWQDNSLSAPLLEKMAILGNQILACRNEIREQMKIELNEI